MDAVYSLFGDERKERDSAAKTGVPFLKVRGPLQVCRTRRRSLLEGAWRPLGREQRPQLRKADGAAPVVGSETRKLAQWRIEAGQSRERNQGSCGHERDCEGGKTMGGKKTRVGRKKHRDVPE